MCWPDHKYERDASLPVWHGWHAFRRGLATVLHDLKQDDLTIQRILRHSNVAITRAAYIKTLDSQTIEAMRVFDTFTTLCAERARNEPSEHPPAVN